MGALLALMFDGLSRLTGGWHLLQLHELINRLIDPLLIFLPGVPGRLRWQRTQLQLLLGAKIIEVDLTIEVPQVVVDILSEALLVL